MTNISIAPARAGALALTCALACTSNGNPAPADDGTDGSSDGSSDGVAGGSGAVDDGEDADDADDGQQTGGSDGGEVPGGPLVGRWRIVGYETTGDDPLSLSDLNDPVNLPGIGTLDGRVNGLMWIREDRIAFASALLFEDHVFPDPAIDDYAEAMQVAGGAAPGVLEDEQFALSGSAQAYEWSRLPDGRILQIDAAWSLTTWERIDDLTPTDALLAEGQVALFQPEASMPLAAPRVAVAWDLPGGVEVLTTDDVALDLSVGVAEFPLAVAEAPPEAVVEVGDGTVAVAHLVVYDDLDGDGVFTAATDELRGVSPIGLAQRDAVPDGPALAESRYSELLPGWQYVHFHPDYSHGGQMGLSPFDPTLVVAPDLIVDVAPILDPIADVVP